MYKCIKEHSSKFPVEKMCQTLEVSRSSYYAWKERPECKRVAENKKIVEVAKKSHAECKGNVWNK